MCEDLIDPTQLGEGVDAPGAQGMNELIFVTLETQLSTLLPF